MKTEILNVKRDALKRALANSGYFAEHMRRGHWRKGSFHLIVKVNKRGRATVDLHMHRHGSPVCGHISIYKGEVVEAEFERIMEEYKRVRGPS